MERWKYEGGSERRREGATGRGRGTGRSVGGREIRRVGNFKGCILMRTLPLANIQYNLLKTTNNAALETLVLQMKNGEQV